jgi:L-threonylcarbamoyladenylate synthase
MTAKTDQHQEMGGAAALGGQDVERLDRCVAEGGVAVLPTDTVYGVCCDPENEQAAQRLYALKGRPAARPAAIMFFVLESALEVLAELRYDERVAVQTLLPGPATLLLANPGLRFAPACRTDPATLGLRVPRIPESLQTLASMTRPVMQSSANISGQPDAHTLAQVPKSMRAGADLVLDGGELPGKPSTVIDLRDYAEHRRWHVLREGALPRAAVREALTSLD